MSSLFDMLDNVNRKATVEAFKSGEKADKTAISAAKLNAKKDKTKEESERVFALRQEAERFRQQQQNALMMERKTSLGEKILKAYFTYKMAGLACHALIALSGGYGHSFQREIADGMARGITSGIRDTADKLGDKIAEAPTNQQRAELIEQTLASLENMSREAEEQGLSDKDHPILTDETREKIQELADISRADAYPEQAEQYASKCQELGLDYNEAKTAFEQDRTFDDLSREKLHEEEQAVERDASAELSY